MNFDRKNDKIIINYLLEYHQNSRKMQQITPKNMWNEISHKINVIIEAKHNETNSSPILMECDKLRTYFERILIFKLKTECDLTPDEYFTVAYPYLDVLKRLEVVFVSNPTTIFDIDKEWLEKLNQIVKYHLNRYTYNHDIWDLYEKLYFVGIRKLEINILNSFFGLNPEEKLQLLLETKRTKKNSRQTVRVNGRDKHSLISNSANNTTSLTTSVKSSDKNSNSGNAINILLSDIATQPNTSLENCTIIKLESLDLPKIEPPLDISVSSPSMDINIVNVELNSFAQSTETNMFNENLLDQRHAMETLPEVQQNSNLQYIEIEEDPTSQLDVLIIENASDNSNSNTINLNIGEVELTAESEMPLVGFEVIIPSNNVIEHRSEEGEIDLRQNDVILFRNQISAIQPYETSPVKTNPTMQMPSSQSDNEESSCDSNMNSGDHIGSQRVVKNKQFEPLVHWSLLFDLYENDLCLP